MADTLPAVANPCSTPKAETFVFLTSPLKPKVSPETLKRSLPSDMLVEFWTAEKNPLTPKTAKQVSKQTNRRVMALLSHEICDNLVQSQVLNPVQSLHKSQARSLVESPHLVHSHHHPLIFVQPSLQSQALKSAQSPHQSQGSTQSLGGQSSQAPIQNVSVKIREAETVKTRKVDNILESVLERLSAVEKELTGVKEELTGAKEELTGVKEELTGAKEELTGVKEQLTDMREEQDVYAPMNSTRRLSVISLMASLLKLVNHTFLRQLYSWSDWETFVGKNLPFPTQTDVSYFRGWWFVYHELLEDEKVSLEDFWKSQLGFIGSKFSKDSAKRRKIDSHTSKEVASEMVSIMAAAEQDCISEVGNGHISREMLRKAIGFYLSLSRPDKNLGQHLLENLLTTNQEQKEGGSASQLAVKERKRSSNPTIFNSLNTIVKINKNLSQKAVVVLNDILTHLDKLGDYNCIANVVQWYGTWLLCMCNTANKREVSLEAAFTDKGVVVERDYSNEEGCSLQGALNAGSWCEELQRYLVYHGNDMYLDHYGGWWYYYSNMWLLWVQENQGWCSYTEGEWRKLF